MSVTAERIDPADPVAVGLAGAMVDELAGLYGRAGLSATPTAEPHELAAFVVLRDAGAVVAGGAVKPLGPGLGEIKRMYVVPSARSRGHSRRLLAELEAVAADLGFWRVRLDTGADQPRARALYESAGYRTIPDYNDNPYATYWGEKDLPAVIPARFNGPPGSGHGGYSAWTAARYLDGPAEVTLKAPPPLEEPMAVTRDGDAVHLGEILSAAPVSLDDVAPPAALGLDAARGATDPSLWAAEHHPFPTCFACGPLRDDGLRLFPGAVGDGRYATTWTPAGDDPALVWAALDCPSCAPHMAPERGPIVLARFAVDIRGPIAPEPHAIVSESVAVDGRKRTSVVALFAADGSVRALARALWIELRR
jgi:GNAT superfamily N-acetyltransferase